MRRVPGPTWPSVRLGISRCGCAQILIQLYSNSGPGADANPETGFPANPPRRPPVAATPRDYFHSRPRQSNEKGLKYWHTGFDRQTNGFQGRSPEPAVEASTSGYGGSENQERRSY